MKKISFTLVFIVSTISILQSCKKMRDHKDESPILTTVNASLNKNASYSYILPSSTTDDNFQITGNAAHAGISQIVIDGATGDLVYQYTPLADYTGTDQVIISTIEEDHNGHGNCIHPTNGKPNPNGAGCQGQHHDDKSYIITINLNINNNASSKANKALGTTILSSAY